MKCAHRYDSGVQCSNGTGHRAEFCWMHDPEASEYRAAVLAKKRKTISERYSRVRGQKPWERRTLKCRT